MSKYRVSERFTSITSLEVEAESEDQAREVFQKKLIAEDNPKDIEYDENTEVDVEEIK
jgi:hypothetical protein